MADKGQPLPKFGEWDVNDPASAEGFTGIFNKARDEKKAGDNGNGSESPGKLDPTYKEGAYASSKPSSVLRTADNHFKIEHVKCWRAQKEMRKLWIRRNGFAACKEAQWRLDDRLSTDKMEIT